MALSNDENEVAFTPELLLEDAGLGEAIHLASQVVLAFVKAVKAFRQYGAKHAQRIEFQQRLTELLYHYLESYSSLVLQISELEFYLQDRAIYVCEDIHASVPFIFYRDGVRELRFHAGVTDAEVENLLDVVAQSDHLNQREDDLVTLLWEREFVHVEIYAIDNFLTDSELVVVETVEDFHAQQSAEPPAHQVDISIGERDWGTPDIPQDAMFDGALPIEREQGLYVLSAEDLQVLKDEVRDAIAPTAIFHTTALLFDMFPLIDNPDTFRTMVSLLKHQLEEMLGLDDPHRPSEVLIRLHTQITNFAAQDWRVPLLSEIIYDMRVTQWNDLLQSLLREEGNELVDTLTNLTLIQPQLILPLLLKVLTESQDMRKRSLIFAVLTRVSLQDVKLVAVFLTAPQWQYARDVAFLLGRIGDKQLVPHLDNGLGHRDPRVRKEVVIALSNIPGAYSLRLLARALEDLAEDVRCQAAQALGKQGGELALAVLMPVVRTTSFSKRSLMEIRAILLAISQCGGANAQKLLEELATRGSIFWWQKTDYIQTLAMQILASMNTPASQAFVHKRRISLGSLLREACSQLHPRQERTRMPHGR